MMVLSVIKAILATLAVVSCSTIYAEAAGSACYWPDGTVASGVFVCNPNNAESTCCANSDYCTTTGYCLSSTAHYYYRSTCTDKTWQSSSCAAVCLSGSTRNNHTYVNILACDDRIGEWCCAYDGPCCNATTLSPQLGDLILSAVATSTISGSAATVTVSGSANTVYTTATATGSTSSSNSTAIGVGIGVPLGIIALAATAYAIWLHRKRGAQGKHTQESAQMALSNGADVFGSGNAIKPAADLGLMHEMGSPDPVVHEAPGTSRDR